MPSVMDRILSALTPEYRALRADVNALQALGEQLMERQEQFDAAIQQLDEATNEVASDLQALRDEIAGGSAISEANLAVLDAKIARLKALGADPENPVPAVEG